MLHLVKQAVNFQIISVFSEAITTISSQITELWIGQTEISSGLYLHRIEEIRSPLTSLEGLKEKKKIITE